MIHNSSEHNITEKNVLSVRQYFAYHSLENPVSVWNDTMATGFFSDTTVLSVDSCPVMFYRSSFS